MASWQLELMLRSHCRADGKVTFGYSLMRGKRQSMEDFHYAQVRSHADEPLKCQHAVVLAARIYQKSQVML